MSSEGPRSMFLGPYYTQMTCEHVTYLYSKIAKFSTNIAKNYANLFVT